MTIDAPPTLPAYDKPKERVPATIPHGILTKLAGKILKTPKLKATLKMMSLKKNPKPVSKPKKKKIV